MMLSEQVEERMVNSRRMYRQCRLACQAGERGKSSKLHVEPMSEVVAEGRDDKAGSSSDAFQA